MSRETLLDEAIVKAKEAEDWQLVEWLRMARGGESAARWYSEKLRHAHLTERRLMTENAKLRELVKDMLDVMLDYRCDIRMPNSLDYSNEPAVFKERARELGIEVKE